MLTVAFLGDKFKIRGPIILIQALVIILGVCLMAFATNGPVRYFGVFLGIGAINANMPAIMSYQHNNISMSSLGWYSYRYRTQEYIRIINNPVI